jgi:hypothetical protein
LFLQEQIKDIIIITARDPEQMCLFCHVGHVKGHVKGHGSGPAPYIAHASFSRPAGIHVSADVLM